MINASDKRKLFSLSFYQCYIQPYTSRFYKFREPNCTATELFGEASNICVSPVWNLFLFTRLLLTVVQVAHRFLENFWTFDIAYSFISSSVPLLYSVVKMKTGTLLNIALYTVEPYGPANARYWVKNVTVFCNEFRLCYFQTQCLVNWKVTYSAEIFSNSQSQSIDTRSNFFQSIFYWLSIVNFMGVNNKQICRQPATIIQKTK